MKPPHGDISAPIRTIQAIMLSIHAFDGCYDSTLNDGRYHEQQLLKLLITYLMTDAQTLQIEIARENVC